ncbi:MAG: CBS domain-containing protein [Gammaproteobacteria bacterium]|nr:MAG: CBS domain-containing protein [Gammaproteobacteria bacterium]
MQTIKQLLDNKGNEISTIDPNDSVYDAIKSMADNHIGSLIVMQNKHVIGIITERDYSRNVILKGKSSANTPVKDIMTSNVLCAKPEQTIEEAMALMTDKRVRHLPVIENGNLLGIVSIGDLVKTIISEQKHIIEQLEHYING